MLIEMPPRKPRAETIIPMINVVFLLLIFFMLTAQIAPPEPFEITPPESSAEIPALQQGVLYLSSGGDMAYGTARDDGVWTAISGANRASPLEIRADAGTPATLIASVLRRLRGIGIAEAQLVVSGH